MDLLLSFAWFAIVAWLIKRAFGQRGLLPRVSPAPAPHEWEARRVAVIVPARDEADNIGRCLHSLVAQDYPSSALNILVVDDHSTDETARIVARIGERHPEVKLISSPPLPPRWTGKSHACWVGVRAAPPDIEWLCFLDADCWGEPPLLSSAMNAALAHQLDLLSIAPRQKLGSFAERLILPCGLVLMSFIQDLRDVQAKSGSGVTATGQFMLIRRDAYDEAGGHAAVASAICEDLEVARRFKQCGRSVLLMDGSEVFSTRMYTGWGSLWPGLAKNMVDTFGGRRKTIILAIAGLVLACAAIVLPLLDALVWLHGARGAAPALIAALSASAAAFAFHIAAARYFRIPFWYGLLFPLGYTIGALMAFDSIRRRLTGRVTWKGRIYS